MSKAFKPYRRGQRVIVFEDVLSQRIPEGEAQIVGFEGKTGSADVYRYRVRFTGETEAVHRNILHGGPVR